MRVLIVEDDEDIADALRRGLAREGIAGDAAPDGETAVDLLAQNQYDVVLLDRDLPGMSGDEVCRIVHTDYPDRRVLMLTAARRLTDKVRGFEVGADDYLTKPFEFPELIARLRALARRAVPSAPLVLECDDLRLDPFRREVYRDGRYLRLARKEFAVLELLMNAGGGVLSAEALLEKAWDENANPFTNAIRVTISTLRRKLGEPDLIETVPGVGYRMAGSDRG